MSPWTPCSEAAVVAACSGVSGGDGGEAPPLPSALPPSPVGATTRARQELAEGLAVLEKSLRAVAAPPAHWAALAPRSPGAPPEATPWADDPLLAPRSPLSALAVLEAPPSPSARAWADARLSRVSDAPPEGAAAAENVAPPASLPQLEARLGMLKGWRPGTLM